MDKVGCRSESELYAKQQAYDKNWSLCNTLAERNRSIKEECEEIVQKYEEVVRIVAGVSVNERSSGNANYPAHMAEKIAKAVLQELYGKDFSDYGFQNARIKAETQLRDIVGDGRFHNGIVRTKGSR